MERWLDIPGYEGAYQVSDLGRVRSLDRVVNYCDGRRRHFSGKVLSPKTLNGGHLTVRLPQKEGALVHRLVLTAFEGPCPQDFEARHLNGNPSDNRLENLSWGSRASNNVDRSRHGSNKLVPSQVQEVRARLHKETHRALAEEFGVSVSTIAHIKSGRCYAHV